jgi:hypothetical protein
VKFQPWNPKLFSRLSWFLGAWQTQMEKLLATWSVFSVWTLKQKGHSSQWSNLLGDPSHSIIELFWNIPSGVFWENWPIVKKFGNLMKNWLFLTNISAYFHLFWFKVKISIRLKIHFIIFSVTLNQNKWKYAEIFVKNNQFFIKFPNFFTMGRFSQKAPYGLFQNPLNYNMGGVS